jgi:hypothetical protein
MACWSSSRLLRGNSPRTSRCPITSSRQAHEATDRSRSARSDREEFPQTGRAPRSPGRTINLRAAAAPLLRVRRSRGHAAARVGLRALVLGPLTVASAVPRAAVPYARAPELAPRDASRRGASDSGRARRRVRCAARRTVCPLAALRRRAPPTWLWRAWTGSDGAACRGATAAKTARLSRILPKSSWHERSTRRLRTR